LPTLEAELAARDDVTDAARALLRRRLGDALGAARRAADALFALLDRRLGGSDVGPVLRLTEDFARDEVWQAGLEVVLENLLGGFDALRDGIESVAERLAVDDPSERRARMVGELRGVVRRLDAAAQGLTSALAPPPGGPPTVRWMERRGRRTPSLSLACVPLDLAPLLRGSLFDRVETVVLTSATLAVRGEFNFLEERLGLDLPPSRVTVRQVLPSPFDFGSQCVFAVPTDLPEPRDDASGHDGAVARVLVDLAQDADGGVFCLFTSHAALRRVADLARPALGGRWPLLVQGDGQRDHLLRRFRESGSAILLGTDSFWEGVDVPGRALRVLILAKLPFRVPSEPLTAARLERLEARGVDAFTHYLLPLAALKLKQGFGRLIRGRGDTGTVVLLDRRIVTKRYGRVMLDGLPPAERVVGDWHDVRGVVAAFFARHGSGAPV
jgi:ATP-dependent DNA helicase DinG